jgi:WD40 repeat protein
VRVVAADAAPVVVVLDQSGGLHVLDSRSGNREDSSLGNIRVEEANWIDVDPTGERVVTLDRSGRVLLWHPHERADPVEVGKITPSKSMGMAAWPFGAFLQFSPTGERIAVGVHGGQTLLFDGEGTPIHDSPEILAEGERLGGSWFDAPLAWSGDGRWLASLTTDGPVLFDASVGKRVDLSFDTGGVQLRSIALDVSGEHLAVGGEMLMLGSFSTADGSRTWWGPLSCEGSEIAMFGTEHLSVAGLAFSPDGEHLACSTAASSHAAIVAASTGKTEWTGAFHGGRMGEPRTLLWSPNSHRLYHTYANGGMPLFRTECEGNEAGTTTYAELPGESVCLPEQGFDGIGVTTDREFVIGIHLDSGEERWRVRL